MISDYFQHGQGNPQHHQHHHDHDHHHHHHQHEDDEDDGNSEGEGGYSVDDGSSIFSEGSTVGSTHHDDEDDEEEDGTESERLSPTHHHHHHQHHRHHRHQLLASANTSDTDGSIATTEHDNNKHSSSRSHKQQQQPSLTPTAATTSSNNNNNDSKHSKSSSSSNNNSNKDSKNRKNSLSRRWNVVLVGDCTWVHISVCKALLARGHRVRLFGRNHDQSESGVFAPDVELFVGNLERKQDVMLACEKMDILIHCDDFNKLDANESQTEFVARAAHSMENILECCVAQGVKKMILISSASVVFAGTDINNGSENQLPFPDHFMHPRYACLAAVEQLVVQANGTPLRSQAASSEHHSHHEHKAHADASANVAIADDAAVGSSVSMPSSSASSLLSSGSISLSVSILKGSVSSSTSSSNNSNTNATSSTTTTNNNNSNSNNNSNNNKSSNNKTSASLSSSSKHLLSTLILRPAGLFGSADSCFLPRLIEHAMKGRITHIIGDGQNVSDFTYVENLAHAVVLATKRLRPGASCAGQTFFITNGEPMQFWSFLAMTLELLSIPPPKKYLSFRLAYATIQVMNVMKKMLGRFSAVRKTMLSQHMLYLMSCHCFFSHKKATRELGYTPLISLEDGLVQSLAAKYELL